jgi:hypothetical protein
LNSILNFTLIQIKNEKIYNTGSKDTRLGFGAGITELGQ